MGRSLRSEENRWGCPTPNQAIEPRERSMCWIKALGRPLHGYAVAEWIEQTSGDVLRVEEAALYPALHRLELRGLLASKWGISKNNRRAKYSSLTAAGRKQLAAQTERWDRMTAARARCLQAA